MSLEGLELAELDVPDDPRTRAHLANQFMEALGKVRDLMSQMSDAKFKNGTWPQAVTG